VRATRCQADRGLYRAAVRRFVENQPNLSLFQQGVADLVMTGERVTGVVTDMGLTFHARAVVLTVGTFLAGRIHIGETNKEGGRAGDRPSNRLAARLREMPFRTGRLKTGTPPRIDGRTVDFSVMTEQPTDEPRPVFSFTGNANQHPRQVSCFITSTNEATHDIIRGALDRSPMYSGAIDSTGPRYCPSVEDKVVRFAERSSHQVFVEPEGLETHELYPNGISTSLPYDAQLEMVRSIRGFENAHITRPGYAIEYDFFDPRDLEHSLQTRFAPGLWFAGQINGTTGYEEAAAQGLLAGLNAARSVRGEAPWCPGRMDAYLGVLVDDLVTQGTAEPYRMFTSRAEYRLLLREDNADLRLTPAGREMGLVDDERWQVFETRRDAIDAESQRLGSLLVRPTDVDAQHAEAVFGGPLTREQRALELLRRPGVTYERLLTLPGLGEPVADPTVAAQVEIQARYAGYINRQKDDIERQRRHDNTALPEALKFEDVAGLSNEVRQKLISVAPRTVGQAARIPGVTPAAVSLLLVHLKKFSGERRSA
ncbi:MAG: tRNA uridine-5-carboxymethylaminomethyl(34) synthesis enzyme MnmG, partial [Pseudomonadota bacterium]